MDRIIDAWLPLTFAVNSINRSMGLQDLYPFVLAPAVIVKLVVHPPAARTRRRGAPAQAAARETLRAIIAGLTPQGRAPGLTEASASRLVRLECRTCRHRALRRPGNCMATRRVLGTAAVAAG